MPPGPASPRAASAMHRCTDGQEIPPIPFFLPLPGSFCDLDHFQPTASDFDAAFGADAAAAVAFGADAAVDATVDAATSASGTTTTARLILNRTDIVTTPSRV